MMKKLLVLVFCDDVEVVTPFTVVVLTMLFGDDEAALEFDTIISLSLALLELSDIAIPPLLASAFEFETATPLPVASEFEIAIDVPPLLEEVATELELELAASAADVAINIATIA